MARLVTDSTSNLPGTIASQYGIDVVPLCVIFPDKTYRESVDITPAQFYSMLGTATTLPTTSQPPASDFEDAFRRAAAGGDEVLCIVLSSKLSGTMASAVAAQRALPDVQVHVFDSALISWPLAFMVEHAAKRMAAGASIDQVLPELEVLRQRSKLLFVVDTLEYLRKGGRIGGASALLGSLLSIKPVLGLKDGRVEPFGKARGKRKALELLIQQTAEAVGTGPTVRTAVLHAASPQEATEFAQKVQETLKCPPPVIAELSPVVGVHTGPGTIGLGAINESWL